MVDNKSLVSAEGVGKEVAKFQAVADQIDVISGGTVEGKDAMLLSSMFFSGYFKDIDSLSKAVVRVAFGKRIGVDVATAVTSLYIIDGKPALEAQAIRNGCVVAGYDIITKKIDGAWGCTLEWRYKGEVLGESTFTKVDAVRRGLIDPTCAETFPDKHNERSVKRYNKYERRWEEVMGCDCKDNWKSMPEEMFLARATTKGAKLYGNRAFKQEVYTVDELQDSPFREDTTPIDIARNRIENAKTVDELQVVTMDLEHTELETLLPDINAKTKELLDAKKTTATDRSTSEK